MGTKEIKNFKDLKINDCIYMMTIDDVKKLRILEISEIKYTKSPSDYYFTLLDKSNNIKRNVLARGDKPVEYIDDKIFVSDSFYQSIVWYNLQSIKFEKEWINKEINR